MLRNYTGPIFIIIAATLWAFDGLIRQHLYTLPPLIIIFLEHLIGLAILTPFVWKNLRGNNFTKKDYGLLILIAILSGLLGTLWFTAALGKVHFITLSVVFLLQKLQPIFAITSATIFLKERFERGYIIWAILALISAYFVTFKNGVVNLETGEGTAIAALYALGAAFAWGTSTTFSKMLLGRVSAKVSTFYRFLFTVIIALPVVFLFGYGPSLTAPTGTQFAWLALIAVSTGMVALLIYYKGLARTPVHISTILELTFPFIAIILDMLVNDVTLSVTQWLAALLLVFSIYRISRLREGSL
ncbi:hypothetical protein A3I95_00260 [Candidatus Nomurabacteria bacterium RIFCSPLOWO2_02_FULL_44_12]|uniref:EamA domain-containing protein n=1 Tax=Candidatus Nomurabacteria bacterium RIFCSPLOWO2_12_FULL_44_11 TaxID=1801796 RepID=A0A1F6Y562_9BACT|nr:MAG: hypothetical protein A3E95_03210 [Candidatus Nomurabacteria bacterium RIFCSPHIGHO2_12_FULL_44_22b]OGJ01504.1 MAG: hypothetical protein A3G53_00100 [Candidatus Nomurabacteria bacterium RIFCSPLOWO2_12_FULL_44_11]OGJ07866.1 MAG: hypothetical protein A3I95_00260 [Candidatus Nomurabacteria bacterium RIFCSPLOWO2_02_FULL_44_12]